MLEIKNLSKTYKNSKVKAIDNVSIEINEGDIYGFIGPNGAGKSTTIKCIVGIHDYEAGEIIFNGENIKKDPLKSKSQMAYVPDNPELYEQMKAIDFINFICDMYEISQDIREKNIKKYAKIFEIESKLNDTIESFSHGMKQKVALISALAHDPKVLIMDEPFINLDYALKYKVMDIIKSIQKKRKNTVIMVTHDIAEAVYMADNIVMLDNPNKINKVIVDINKNRVNFFKLFVRTIIFSGVIISIIQII